MAKAKNANAIVMAAEAADNAKIWGAITVCGTIESAAERLGLPVATVKAAVQRRVQSTEDSLATRDHIRAIQLEQLARMQAPQYEKAVVNGDTEAVSAVLGIMRHVQTLVPGLKVADRQEITGADGGPLQTENKSLSLVDAVNLVDELKKAAGAKST